MKKITVILFLLMSVLVSQAQKHKVVSAYNYLRKGQLDKALESIEPTIENSGTKEDTKTWFYRGNIFFSILLSEDEKYQALSENPLKEAYESYKKAIEFDVKGKYKDDLSERMQLCSEQYFNKAVNEYKEGIYKEASIDFETAAQINHDFNRIVDTASIYYAGNSADLGGDGDRALLFYNKALDLQYNKPSLFALMSNAYMAKADTVKALEVLMEGKKIFPDDFDIIICETNIYLAQGNTEKALENLKIAIQADPENEAIWFAVGSNYDKLMQGQEDAAIKESMMNEAITAYKKALELNPEYFNPAFNLGAVYVNIAAHLQTEANNLPLSETEKYDAMKLQADQTLEMALPYLEKAHEIQADDIYTLHSLKEIYIRLKMNDKLKEVSDKLNAIE